VRDNMAGGARRADDRVIPYVMFTGPPLAHVGLAERGAERLDMPVPLAKLPMSKVLRTAATRETARLLEGLLRAEGDRILVFVMLGSEAGEVMAVIQTAMIAGMPYPKLRDAVIAHLTVSEGFGPLFANVPARSM